MDGREVLLSLHMNVMRLRPLACHAGGEAFRAEKTPVSESARISDSALQSAVLGIAALFGSAAATRYKQ
jgi:hypothetical protein